MAITWSELFLGKTNKGKTAKSTQLSLVLIGLHDFLPICSVSVFFDRIGSHISPPRAKKDSNIPSPGRTRSVKCPTPGLTKTVKSPPQALLSLQPPLPPPPRRPYIDRCINPQPVTWSNVDSSQTKWSVVNQSKVKAVPDARATIRSVSTSFFLPKFICQTWPL